MMMVNVPEDQQDAVSQWTDGETYQITVKQKAPGEFDLVSVDGEGSEPPNDTDAKEESTEPGSMADTGGTTIPSKNPAVASLIMSKRGK